MSKQCQQKGNTSIRSRATIWSSIVISRSTSTSIGLVSVSTVASTAAACKQKMFCQKYEVLKLVRLQTWRIGCWWCTTTTLLSAVASYWAISSSVSRVGCWTLALISPSTRGWSRTSICRCSLVVTAITTIATSTTTTSSRISIFYVEIVI